MSGNNNYNSFNGPNDINLAFFAYGILKPGEIAYSRIKEFIDNKDDTNIHFKMKQRDGVPILLRNENEKFKTIGNIYHFNNKTDAYDEINKIISNELYEWGTIRLGTDDVNVLFGKDPNHGSDDIENTKDRNDSEDFKGKHDLLFENGINLIRKNLNTENFYHEDGFLQLQMNYMLLWSAIDRYCKLKYNKEDEYANRIALSEDDLFIDALKNIKNKKVYRKIYTTDSLVERNFNTNKPKWCINYYYTLRCNIVHRGKSNVGRDLGLLKKATEDLLDIFEYILENTFKEED